MTTRYECCQHCLESDDKVPYICDGAPHTEPCTQPYCAGERGHEPSPLDRIEQLIAAGEVRVCRQSKPLTEHDARLLLEFHEQLSKQTPPNPDHEDR